MKGRMAIVNRGEDFYDDEEIRGVANRQLNMAEKWKAGTLWWRVNNNNNNESNWECNRGNNGTARVHFIEADVIK